MSEEERAFREVLQPARAPESLWFRVEAELAAPPANRTMSRLALVFGVMLVAVVSVAGYLDKPQKAPGRRK